jgi:pyridoxamine 5'-phosphate oxidase
MVLATRSADGTPSARAVLLRGFDDRGLVFFTDRRSRKGSELARDPRAALALLWARSRRQVRVEGRVALLTDAESDAYFAKRPRGNRIAAWASHQSKVIRDRAILERRVRIVEARYRGAEVPRPPFWGGYRVVPRVFEFWQSRSDRLHDRMRYRKVRGRWIRERLSP